MLRKNKIKMTKIVLAISFLILFGRLVYSGLSAWSHHQEQTQVEQSVKPAP